MGATTYIKFCKIGALSPDGSRPYDKDANGFVMVRVVLSCVQAPAGRGAGGRSYLRCHSLAWAAQRRQGKSITAPNPIGQILALASRLAARWTGRRDHDSPRGAMVPRPGGDVAEMETVTKLLSEGSPIKHRIALGSIKSQIGHLKSAAGAASLLKVVLACHHKILPPSINFNQPNPNIAWDKLPLFVNTKVQPWEKPSFGPRRCGLSAFGFGGAISTCGSRSMCPAC